MLAFRTIRFISLCLASLFAREILVFCISITRIDVVEVEFGCGKRRGFSTISKGNWLYTVCRYLPRGYLVVLSTSRLLLPQLAHAHRPSTL